MLVPHRVLAVLLAALALTAAGASTDALLAKDRPRIAFAGERGTAFDAALETERARQDLVGLAVAVIEEGQLAHVGTYGLADRDAKRAVTAETLFRWASVSKPLTAVAAMQLVEQERLALADRADAHLPDLREHDLGRVTVEQLLSHRAGVGHYREMGDWVRRLDREYGKRDEIEWDAAKSVAVAAGWKLAHEPGQRYHYTTFGYNVAGAIVEAAGRQPFEAQVHERIAKPLGITTLEPDYEFRKRPDRTAGYRRKGEQVAPSSAGDVSWKLPGGGFHSTVGDLARFGAGLLSGKLLSEATQREMWRLREGAGKSSGYALGFGVRVREREVVRVSHSGAQPRTRTLLVLEPQHARGIAIMTNSEWANVGEVAASARRALGW